MRLYRSTTDPKKGCAYKQNVLMNQGALKQTDSMVLNVTVPEKTDHFAQISHTDILVPHCSVVFTLPGVHEPRKVGRRRV